ncbi:MAG: hypothetical protein JRI97_08945 [Deltaproteobacteria bacterium]|nr:hypothetical protein [Deltaproteobacteria bacterium]
MIELCGASLLFRFPEACPWAVLEVSLVRGLPGREKGAGDSCPRVPLSHVDDHADRVPASWVERGGVMGPLYPGEALWLEVSSRKGPEGRPPYPFAVKAGTGKLNFLTLAPWKDALDARTQDYAACPPQRWIAGITDRSGDMRGMVARELFSEQTVEKSVTGHARFGGVQLAAYPMHPELYASLFGVRPVEKEYAVHERAAEFSPDLGVEWGGPVDEGVLPDPHGYAAWDQSRTARAFVHLADARAWKRLTGQEPPPPLDGPTS